MTGILVIGSNTGNRKKFIECALGFLAGICTVMRQSDIYESPDCLGSGSKYLNAVMEVSTDLTESALNSLLKEFEIRCGRDGECRQRGEVPVDIDIVVWDGKIRRPADYNASYFKIGYRKITVEKRF